MSENIYENKKILLTGATGFLGSCLLKKLLAEGYDVTILKRSFSDIRRLPLEGGYKSYDIDKTVLPRIFAEEHFNYIIHTATCYGRNSVPIKNVIKSNLYFSLELLEEARKNQCCFINTDTFFSEIVSYGYLNCYCTTKRHVVDYSRIYSENIPVVNMKSFHLYGPDDSEEKFIPAMIRRMKENQTEIALTPCNQKRDFIYIDDAVDAYLCIIKKTVPLPGFTEYEVGTGTSYSIKYVLQSIKKQIQSTSLLNFGKLPMRVNEPMDSKAENDNIRALGWSPKYSIQGGLQKTIFS